MFGLQMHNGLLPGETMTHGSNARGAGAIAASALACGSRSDWVTAIARFTREIARRARNPTAAHQPAPTRSATVRHADRGAGLRFALLALLVGAAAISRAENTPFGGQVVDERGKPVKDAEVGVNWTTTGKDWACDSTFKTDKDGRFSGEIDIDPKKPVGVMAFDKPKRRGGVVVASAEQLEGLKITIDTLASYNGAFDISSLKSAPEVVVIELQAVSESGPTARVVRSEWPVKKKFMLKLPPGGYEVSLDCEGGERAPRKLNLKSGKADEAGKLILSPRVPRAAEKGDPAKDEAGNADGKDKPKPASKPATEPAPPLTVTEVRGGPRSVRISDYKGKWLVLGFWGYWQGSCTGKAIPWMIQLPEKYKAQRTRLALLSFHYDRKGTQSLVALEPELARLETELWKTKLPFPVVVDASGKTIKDWKIEAYPTLLLIDPEGRIMARGESAIETRLSEAFDGPAKSDDADAPKKSDPAKPKPDPKVRPAANP